MISPAWVSAEDVRVYDYHISPGVWGLSGSNIGRVGVIAHETGHFFGLPDLYDTDSSNGQGIGSYGMMANSWGFDGSQLYPPHFSPWSKIQLGWLSATPLSQSGNYALSAAEITPQVYRIDQGYPSGEYLLIENRQPLGFDAAMPQGGLAIWHIDELAGYNTEGYPGQAGWPSNGNHYRVALLQADGNYNLEQGNNRGDAGDLWHGTGVHEINPSTLPSTDTYQGGNITTTHNRIFDISAAGELMSFSYEDLNIPIEPPVPPTLLDAQIVNDTDVTLNWQDNSNNEDGFHVLRDGQTIASLVANTSTYRDQNVAAGTHQYQIQAHNNNGNNQANSNTLSVELILPSVARVNAETLISGTQQGDYRATWQLLGEEILTEEESGGKPAKRTSLLEHTWHFSGVGSSAQIILNINAYAPANAEGDGFAFSYSSDGSNFSPALLLMLGMIDS